MLKTLKVWGLIAGFYASATWQVLLPAVVFVAVCMTAAWFFASWVHGLFSEPGGMAVVVAVIAFFIGFRVFVALMNAVVYFAALAYALAKARFRRS